MSYYVNIESYDSLTEDEKRNFILPNNGPGKEYASYLVVKSNGKTIRIESSTMEPEDVSFHRDLKWVSEALMEAYIIGRNDESSTHKVLK